MRSIKNTKTLRNTKNEPKVTKYRQKSNEWIKSVLMRGKDKFDQVSLLSDWTTYNRRASYYLKTKTVLLNSFSAWSDVKSEELNMDIEGWWWKARGGDPEIVHPRIRNVI